MRRLYRSNYAGFLIDKDTETVVSTQVANRSLFYNRKNIDDPRLEDFWFSLDHAGVPSFLFSGNDTVRSSLMRSGLVKTINKGDLFNDGRSTSDQFTYYHTGEAERVRLCNVVRDQLAKLSTGYRWLGCELESLLHSRIPFVSHEMISNKHWGCFLDINGTAVGDYPSGGNQIHLQQLYSNAQAMPDPGQSKLYSIYLGAQHGSVPIVYLGASPGLGWIKARDDLYDMTDIRPDVLAVDIRELTSHSEGVTFYNEAIRGANSFYHMLEQWRYTDIKKVLIWDIRGDVGELDADDKNATIETEIKILNGIISHDLFSKHFMFYQFKIHRSLVDKYLLPDDVRFILQPFCMSRGLLELRAIGYVSSVLNLSQPSATRWGTAYSLIYATEGQVCVGELSDYQLFLNVFATKYRFGNYITSERISDCETDICLYSINCNPPECVKAYMDRCFTNGINFIISFFTAPALNEGEYEFPVHSLYADRNCTILDSRSFIPAKISLLYFVINGFCLQLFNDELRTSETYVIKHVEREIRVANQISKYDCAKHR